MTVLLLLLGAMAFGGGHPLLAVVLMVAGLVGPLLVDHGRWGSFR